MSDYAIKVENLTKLFWIPRKKRDSIIEYVADILKHKDLGATKHEVIKDVNFEIKCGESVGIMGSNGSGKTTLLKILAGIYAPTFGNIRITGNVIPFIGLGVGFNQDLSGRDNVYINGSILGLTEKQLKKKIDEIVEFAEIGEFIDVPIKNYSSGMIVRLAFSISMLADADIYLFDEVFAVGDNQFQQKCKDVFSKRKKSNKTLVLVTHSGDLVKNFCDTAYIIKDKKVITDTTVDECINTYLTE